MRELSRFYSQDGAREAAVMWNSGSEELTVYLYEDKLLEKTISMEGKSMQYCEDACENYVNYVGAFAK